MKLRMKHWWLTIVLIAPLLYPSTRDNGHFYRAPHFWDETRLEKDFLSSFDITFAGGWTKHGHDQSSCKVDLLNIYGAANMHQLGLNVPGKDLSTKEDTALTMLSLVPANGNFGKFAFSGSFETYEATFAWTQNIKCGFFLQAHIPIRHLQICDIKYCDLSPTACQFPNKNTPEWQVFLNLFDAILKKYTLSIGNITKNGIGDTTVLVGWTRNYEDTEEIDLIDLTIKTGFLAPTGARKNEDLAFDLPLGYNGHWAIPAGIDLALGAYDWLTLGMHLSALFFFDTTRQIRLQTSAEQSGFIKLAKDCAKIQSGSLWHAAGYLKADHFAQGLSLLFGYSLMHKNESTVAPVNSVAFNAATANSDQMLQDWQSHTLHCMVEYDFTKEESSVGPRVGLFYDFLIGGKRIFKTSMIGLGIGLEILWNW
jgi:hypothetical protein